MAEYNFKVITKHKLEHIAELQLDPDILHHRFSSGCSTCACNGACCAEGVLLDITEKERILANAEIIKKYLEPEQEHDTSKWFDHNIELDIDFPSGKCDGTAANNGKCVFLDKRGLCALQKAATSEGMDKYYLKPFYCVAFPLVIDSHVLTTDDPDFINTSKCWTNIPDGPLTVLDVCKEEFKYILGNEGFNEIEEIFNGAARTVKKKE